MTKKTIAHLVSMSRKGADSSPLLLILLSASLREVPNRNKGKRGEAGIHFWS